MAEAPVCGTCGRDVADRARLARTRCLECRRTLLLVADAAQEYEAACAGAVAVSRYAAPDGARCYICLEGENLVRGCACRGDAGFVHIECLVAFAESKDHDDEYEETLLTCRQCEQGFGGHVALAIDRAAWLRFSGRAERDPYRQATLWNLGGALNDLDRHREALVVKEELFATRRRLYGPDDWRTVDAEENIAITLRTLVGEENMQNALEILKRTYAWKIGNLGRNDRMTLEAAVHLADAYFVLGDCRKCERIRRHAVPGFRSQFGETHVQTLEARWLHAAVLVALRRVDEARAIRDEVLPLAQRVLGPGHRIARFMGDRVFLDPSRFDHFW
mmetsp:Transcript_4554/g.13463  ORF Transcript_4554/g.13463 Transcript_4554/m.13463 type:complete len:333 (+) Transcript_4554:223-1221(+)